MKKLFFFGFVMAVFAVTGCQPPQPAQPAPGVQNNYYNNRPPVIVAPQPAPPIIVAPPRPPVIVVPSHCPHCKQPCGPGHVCPPGTHIGVGPGGIDINIRK